MNELFKATFDKGYTKYGIFQYTVTWSDYSRRCNKCGRMVGSNGTSYVYQHFVEAYENHLCRGCHRRYFSRLRRR